MTVTSLRAADMPARQTGIDVAALTDEINAARPLGSSWRYRRLVIAGHVLWDPIALAKPAMRPAETAFLTRLAAGADRVLEFGAGGSTALILKMGVRSLVSVESDGAWLARLRRDPAIARALKMSRLVLYHADIGPTGFMGGPRSQRTSSQWADYSRAAWCGIDETGIDLVFIDGRFRVACILEAVLRCDPRTVIAVHDFWNRPAYHCVLPFVDTLARVDTLAVFRRSATLDRGAAADLLEKCRLLPL